MSIHAVYPISGFSDPVSSMTHLAGAGVFAVLGVLLLRRGRGDTARVACLAVYAVSCVVLMSVSGVYHLLEPGGTGRLVMLRLDHAAIFVMIAGTFTPVHGILFHGRWRWEPIILLWTVTATAVTLKMVFFNDVPEIVGLLLYLCLGWVGVVTGFVLWFRYGWRFTRLLAWGGLAYSVGAVTDYLGWFTVIPGVVGPHEFFHLAVLAGALLQWKFVYSFAAGPPPRRDIKPAVQTAAQDEQPSAESSPRNEVRRVRPKENVPDPSC